MFQKLRVAARHLRRLARRPVVDLLYRNNVRKSASGEARHLFGIDDVLAHVDHLELTERTEEHLVLAVSALEVTEPGLQGRI